MNSHKDTSPAADTAAADGSTADVPGDATVQTAGAFDIRNFIGLLVGIFGVVLVLMGLFAFDPAESAKTDGMNANLWAGIGMAVVGAAFLLWAKLEPIRIVVRENEPGAEDKKDIAAL